MMSGGGVQCSPKIDGIISEQPLILRQNTTHSIFPSFLVIQRYERCNVDKWDLPYNYLAIQALNPSVIKEGEVLIESFVLCKKEYPYSIQIQGDQK